MKWDLMNIYPNVLTWSTSTLHRHLVHSPTKGHRCDSWTKVFLISLSGTGKMPRREYVPEHFQLWPEFQSEQVPLACCDQNLPKQDELQQQ